MLPLANAAHQQAIGHAAGKGVGLRKRPCALPHREGDAIAVKQGSPIKKVDQRHRYWPDRLGDEPGHRRGQVQLQIAGLPGLQVLFDDVLHFGTGHSATHSFIFRCKASKERLNHR